MNLHEKLFSMLMVGALLSGGVTIETGAANTRAGERHLIVPADRSAIVPCTDKDGAHTKVKKGDRKSPAKNRNGKERRQGGKKGHKGSGENEASASVIRGDVLAWILAQNQGLGANFLTAEPPDKTIKIPDGQTVPIYKLKQFLEVNFRLTFYARTQDKGAKIVPEMEEKLRKLMALPDFYQAIKTYRKEGYIISPKGRVTGQEAYDHFRRIHRNLGVTAGKQYHAPVGGGGGIAAPSWAVWKKMNLFFHEACHCIGIGHDSGGLSGPIAGKLEKWNRKKMWNYATIDLNALTVPQT